MIRSSSLKIILFYCPRHLSLTPDACKSVFLFLWRNLALRKRTEEKDKSLQRYGLYPRTLPSFTSFIFLGIFHWLKRYPNCGKYCLPELAAMAFDIDNRRKKYKVKKVAGPKKRVNVCKLQTYQMRLLGFIESLFSSLSTRHLNIFCVK